MIKNKSKNKLFLGSPLEYDFEELGFDIKSDYFSNEWPFRELF